MNNILIWVSSCSASEAFLAFLVLNICIFSISVLLRNCFVRWKSFPRVSPVSQSISQLEIVLCSITVLLNTLTTLLGWFLWKWGWINISAQKNFLWVIADFLILFFVMDFSMYLLHRLAHWKLLYDWIHKTHHLFVAVSPRSLFVLNPLENMSFGLLWLVTLFFYSPCWAAVSIYLATNVLFGIIGHLGVEFLPARSQRIPLFNLLAGSTFHAHHHCNERSNFGFYTILWDKIFSTLSAQYYSHYGKILPKFVAE